MFNQVTPSNPNVGRHEMKIILKKKHADELRAKMDRLGE
jgi:hypothetical protein